MKLEFKLELFCIRCDYATKTDYLLMPNKDNYYKGQAAYVTEDAYKFYKGSTDVWRQYHTYKKIWPKPTISTTEII